MTRIVLVVMVGLFLLTVPGHAFFTGHVAVDYDTLNQDWYWVLSVDKHITDWWLVGTSLGTYAPGYGFKYFIPSWIPHRLDYEVYTEFRYKDFSLRITDWCDHWFAQSGQHWLADRAGLTVRLRYDF
jgi:hypothetical protein